MQSYSSAHLIEGVDTHRLAKWYAALLLQLVLILVIAIYVLCVMTALSSNYLEKNSVVISDRGAL